ncbi:uncharacterized protein LOC135828411 isoform X1 [Sycon ciliatum]|uniref:uncharacterized protein LOC135828411 isoform X1 n=2 Tax=Sycon ciliatum TaxID=27933 RepID=UPI0031F6BB8D
MAFTTLFVNGVRQIRARYPNGDPQQMSGVCYYVSQEGDEGCQGYATASGAISEDARLDHLFKDRQDGSVAEDLDASQDLHSHSPLQTAAAPSPSDTMISVDKPVRPHHVTGDDHWPSFHYHTYSALDGVPGLQPVYSFWNDPYRDRPKGIKYGTEMANRTASWSNPSTGVVHMFHTQYWGNWMFQLDSVNTKKHELYFKYGGWQEARGGNAGKNHYYVENIAEELDSPGEWFLDTDTSTLYFYPNATQCADLQHAEVVAPQHSSLVQLRGSGSSRPVRNIHFAGLTFTETRTTFLDYYEVPSGGDWSIHRNAAFFIQDASDCTVTNCTFDAVGGNAIFLSEYVRNCTVSHNEITLTGDSAVVAVGRAGMMDGMQPSYPARNLISNNHIHDFGMYGKQVSCYFQALACGNMFVDNVCYNGPRAGINFNDGFGGDTLLRGNLIFNMVRETDDHGMFNSWDRQPYITPAQCTDGPPSIVPAPNHITQNFIINGYAGRWSIDHDDGSAYYNNSGNFMVFGGVKAYLGHDKMTGPGNVIVYPGIPARSAGKRACQCDDNGEFADQYYIGNQCFTPDGVFYTLYKCDPQTLAQHVFQTRNNRHYSPQANFRVQCGKKTFTFAEWQAAGQDFNSSVSDLPSPEQIVVIGMSVLQQV